MRNALSRLRAFCLDEREVSNARIAELTTALQIKKRLKDWLQKNLSAKPAGFHRAPGSRQPEGVGAQLRAVPGA